MIITVKTEEELDLEPSLEEQEWRENQRFLEEQGIE